MGARHPPEPCQPAGALTDAGLAWQAGLVTEAERAQPTDPLVAVACAKAGLVWVTAEGRGTQAVWHVWHAGAVHLVVGGGEQPDPVPQGAGTVEVQVPSKDDRGRLVTFTATVERLGPVHPDWEAAVFRLQAGRLNAPDAAELLARWATESSVLRLTPRGTPSEGPGHYDDGSGAVPLRRSPATTVTWHPFHLGGRTRRRRSR